MCDVVGCCKARGAVAHAEEAVHDVATSGTLRILVQLRGPDTGGLSPFGSSDAVLEEAQTIEDRVPFTLDTAYAPQRLRATTRLGVSAGVGAFHQGLRWIPSLARQVGAISVVGAVKAGMPTPGAAGDRALAAARLPERLRRRSTSHARETDTGDSYVVRGALLAEGEIPRAVDHLLDHPAVVGVYTDPVIAPLLVSISSPAIGDHAEVARRLAVSDLRSAGMTGEGVDVAIVDGGINVEFLREQGLQIHLAPDGTWAPLPSAAAPGAHPMDRAGRHGTMCAYAAAIAAPGATLLDHALLRSGGLLDAHLSQAIQSYRLLADRLEEAAASGTARPLVITNSWGMDGGGLAQDTAFNGLGRYRDRREHPFNEIVGELQDLGADILFAAGNFGEPHPAGPWPAGEPMITGANSHPAVLCVGGVDLSGARAGYSSQGPGALSKAKPDVMAYTHFLGSRSFGPEDPDMGTSAACPVAAGVLAAVRSRFAPRQLSPRLLRGLLRASATRPDAARRDDDYGWGTIEPRRLLALLDDRYGL